MARLLTDFECTAYLEQLTAITHTLDHPPIEICSRLVQILQAIYSSITDDELQTFASFHARQVYVHTRLDVPQALALALLRTSSVLRHALTNHVEYPREQLRLLEGILATWINWHYERQSTPVISTHIALPPSIAREQETRSVLRAVVGSCSITHSVDGTEIPHVHCTIESGSEEINVQLHGRWRHHASLLQPGMTIHVIDPSWISTNTIACTNRSMFVIEPDFLIDITTVAECFSGSLISPLLALWRLLMPQRSSLMAVVGTVINACFDELLADPTTPFQDAIDHALRTRYLDVTSSIAQQQLDLSQLEQQVEDHLRTIRHVINQLKGHITTEPTFLAPLYGLQGRLDVLIEDPMDQRWKTIIELKSGTPPPTLQHLASLTGKHYTIGMHPQHAMQATGYNLLLDAVYDNRNGDSQVLYSRSSTDPLRNAPNVHDFKADFLEIRNQIVTLYLALARRNFSPLKQLFQLDMTGVPPFITESLSKWNEQYPSLDKQERLYYHALLSFALREYAAIYLTSSSQTECFASLWQRSIEEKTSQLTALTYLIYDSSGNDLDQGYIRLRFSENTPLISPFRVGDIAVLYPHNSLRENKTLAGQIFKCTIKELTDTSVLVSLRNKRYDRTIFHDHLWWALDPDVLNVGVESLVRSCTELVWMDANRRALLLARQSPRSQSIDIPRPKELTDMQYQLLCDALSAQDYFLLQGPPGTGKTRTMLRSMVQYLIENTTETVLCAALTNRAVDEICSALAPVLPENSILRMGSSDATEHQELSLAAYAQCESFDAILERISTARVIVSTVPSINANPSLFELKQFTTAIIDEASQLLESHLLGIWARIQRIIMIGDICQLPAVVQQDERGCRVNHPLLESIELRDVRSSLFERLLRICKRNDWKHAYGQLTQQARMHERIAEFASIMFYETPLQSLHNWQVQDPTHISSSDHLPQPLRSRLIFIDTPTEPHGKFNNKEAHLAAICAAILACSNDGEMNASVGIITPFRKQIRTIIGHLPLELRGDITVDTVERFQGSERDHIIISCAVNTPFDISLISSIVELDEKIIDRKLNVALTRARQQVILLGNRAVLETNKLYAALIEYIGQYGTILNYSDAWTELNSTYKELASHANNWH